jgi:hypothetical protein
MAVLLVLFGVASLPALVFALAPAAQRKRLFFLLVLSAVLFAAAIGFVVSVNLGWVSP